MEEVFVTLSRFAFVGKYQLVNEIGRGTFGSVWKALHVELKTYVAIKFVDREMVNSDPNEANSFESEVSMLKTTIYHPNIVQLFEIIYTKNYFALVMELCNGGSLEYFTHSAPVSESTACELICGVLSGLYYLHSRNIVHRDIKAQNILLGNDYVPKISDFGLSFQYDPNMVTTKACGSPAYSAPELILRKPYDMSVDIWSCGILLYYIVIGNFPWNDSDIPRLLGKIIETDLVFPNMNNLSMELKDLLSKMLEKKPSKRISLKEISEHPWILKSKIKITEKRRMFSSPEEVYNDPITLKRLQTLNINIPINFDFRNNYDSISGMYRILYNEKKEMENNTVTKSKTGNLNILTHQSNLVRISGRVISDAKNIPIQKVGSGGQFKTKISTIKMKPVQCSKVYRKAIAKMFVVS